MPSRLVHIEHSFGGGWAPDYGSMARVQIDEAGRCEIPWLDLADNYEFEYDGSPRKIGGADLLFDSPLEDSAIVRGIYDFWVQGTSGSPVQRRVIHIANKVYMDTGDGVFSVIFTGLQDDSVPDYAANEGQLIIAQTGSDVPMVTDGVTHTALPAGTPNFAFSIAHKLRHWAAGVDAARSHLFYSAQEDPTDWTGTGSGDIAISPGDGDQITALASFNNELIVFKGPNRGSIHRIAGSAPTGSDAFARKDFIADGLGAVGQRTVFRFGNDIGFMWSDGSFHSINTTDRYGDFLEMSLSRPLNKYLRNSVNPSRLNAACAAVDSSLGRVRIALPVSSATQNNTLITMDYRFDPPRWSRSPILGPIAQSLAMVVDGTIGKRPRMMSGGAGLVHKLDSPTKSIARWLGLNPDIDSTLRTPYLTYFESPRMATIYFAGVRVVPLIAKNFTLSWNRDGRATQSTTIMQWTGDVLAPSDAAASDFTLGTSELSGERSISTSKDLPEGGEFKQIQYQIEATGEAHDIYVQSILASIKPGAVSTEAIP